jgi:1-deoxy-D-xylulose-5-phosphate synthase
VTEQQHRLLGTIDSPADLRALPEAELVPLAAELREFMLNTVADNGGHLAAGLGTVELTVALHYLFDTPHDLLVWDVGHQCYPHKILTGRRDRLSTIRKRGGLSGFLRRDESPYDTFGAGHSSTSISAALGMAIASAKAGERRHTIAIIGDGGMTAGLAYEAIDHAGATDSNLIVVLNDNGMSISPNVGALHDYLQGENEHGKRAAAGRLFGDLGFEYFGPVDGNDLPAVLEVLRAARDVHRPRFVHVVTRKGAGYAPAEIDPIAYHGVTRFDPRLGIVSNATQPTTYTQVFGDWLCEMAEHDPKLVAITPAMREGSGLVKFAKRFPDRYFDVGIAEQHAVTLAAGLAAQGLKPVVAIYSTFLQRGYDQLIHDVAMQQLPVMFAIDRAGVVGPDGATHNGSFDLSFLRCIPELTIMTPADAVEMRRMLSTGFLGGGCTAVRYPRSATIGAATSLLTDVMQPGTAKTVRTGSGCALLAFGTVLDTAMKVAERIDATVINMRFVKPLDTAAILAAARGHELVVTLEENVMAGGAGSAVLECLAANDVLAHVMTLGLPDSWGEHGTRDEVLRDAALDVDSVLEAVERRLARIGGRRVLTLPSRGNRESSHG